MRASHPSRDRRAEAPRRRATTSMARPTRKRRVAKCHREEVTSSRWVEGDKQASLHVLRFGIRPSRDKLKKSMSHISTICNNKNRCSTFSDFFRCANSAKSNSVFRCVRNGLIQVHDQRRHPKRNPLHYRHQFDEIPYSRKKGLLLDLFARYKKWDIWIGELETRT